MSENSPLNEEDFNALLDWFAPNRDEAGAKYEEIRKGLIRYFEFKGCSDAEGLADETINRVARKFSGLNRDNDNKHITYFYGFADKIYLEYRRTTASRTVEFKVDSHSKQQKAMEPDELGERVYECLERCLTTLSVEDKQLITQYFSKDRGEKQEFRRTLAENQNLTIGTLRVQIYRLKGILKNCINKCLKEK